MCLPNRNLVSQLSNFWVFGFRFCFCFFGKKLMYFRWDKMIVLSLQVWVDLLKRNAMNTNRALWQGLWIQNTSLKMNIFPRLYHKHPQPQRYDPYIRILTEKALWIITGWVQSPLELIERLDTISQNNNSRIMGKNNC